MDGEYLGDGVYASFDGFQIWLKTERHEVTDVPAGHWKTVEHSIALEPTVLRAFEAWVERVQRSPALYAKVGQNG